MAERRVGGDRGQALVGADHGGGEHGRGRDQPQGDSQVVAVRQAGGQGAHRLDRGQVEQAGIEGGDLGEHFGAGRAQGRGQIGRQLVEESFEQGADQILEPRGAGQLVERMAADDQLPALAVDFRHHGVGGDDVFKAIGHGKNSSCLPRYLPASWDRQS